MFPYMTTPPWRCHCMSASPSGCASGGSSLFVRCRKLKGDLERFGPNHGMTEICFRAFQRSHGYTVCPPLPPLSSLLREPFASLAPLPPQPPLPLGPLSLVLTFGDSTPGTWL